MSAIRNISRRSPMAISSAAPAPTLPIAARRAPSNSASRWISKMRSAQAVLAVLVLAVAGPVQAETVEIYSAGSLREVVTQLIKEGAPQGVEVKPVFGGSGGLRERIEQGEAPDLFLSADLGSPQKLADAGKTLMPVVAFARNRM